MNRERMEQLVGIANGLSNDDICWLFNALSQRCSVYVGLAGNHCLSAGISDVFCNGVEIQINLETCEEDSISGLPWWRDAILEEAKRIRARARAEKRGEA